MHCELGSIELETRNGLLNEAFFILFSKGTAAQTGNFSPWLMD